MPANHTQRSCGTCTACCDGWLQITVHEHKIYPGNKCPFSSAGSCQIYKERPHDPCQQFVCGWLLDKSPLPEWMRPDQATLIFLPANFRWRDLPVDVAVPVGTQPKRKALDWLKTFSADNKRLLIYQIDSEWFAFGPPAFQADISARLRNGERLWDDAKY